MRVVLVLCTFDKGPSGGLIGVGGWARARLFDLDDLEGMFRL